MRTRSSIAQMTQQEVTDLDRTCITRSPDIITEADLHDLPGPVQRYLRYTGIIGKKRISSLRLKQEGLFRMKPGKKWIPFSAEEYYAIEHPSFIWFAKLKMLPFLSLTVRDTYRNGHGNILGKLTPLLTLLDQSGPKIDQGTLLRYLQEMVWFPSAFLEEHIHWEAIDDRSARATIDDRGYQVSGIFYFDEQGKVVNFEAERYMNESKERWSVPLTRYARINGLNLPVEGEGVWKLESGDFYYISAKITEIEYNTLKMY